MCVDLVHWVAYLSMQVLDVNSGIRLPLPKQMNVFAVGIGGALWPFDLMLLVYISLKLLMKANAFRPNVRKEECVRVTRNHWTKPA